MSNRGFGHGSTPKDRDLLPLVKSVVDACISRSTEDQRKLAECLNRVWSGTADTSTAVEYYIPKKRSSDGDPLRNLLGALEACTDDLCLAVICKLIHDSISVGSIKCRQKRHRKLIKADATSVLLRTLRFRLKDVISQKDCARTDGSSATQNSDDTVAALVLAVGAKDCRLSLKIRVGGVLQMLCSLMVSECEDPLSLTMARLLCRSLRSPRNAQLAGRHRGFTASLLVRISSLKAKDSAQCLLLARYLEVLFSITKNRKTRVHLVGESVIGYIVPLIERHFWRRKVNNRDHDCSMAEIHSEICLISVALLRLLSNNKRAKAQLISCEVLALSEKIMNELENEDLILSSTASHLQNSLCALCLRCLPPVCFPIAGRCFPFKCTLPNLASPTRKRRSSKSPQKHRTDVSCGRTAGQSVEMYEAESSDEDGDFEEDEVFSEFRRDDEEFICDVDYESDGLKEDIPRTQLKISELDPYKCCFVEYQHGAVAKRRTAFVSHQTVFQQNAQTTRSVIPFVKIAFPEMQNPDVDMPRQSLCDSRTSLRELVVHEIARARTSNDFRYRVVFDLDRFATEEETSRTPSVVLSNDDSARVGRVDPNVDHLLFESRFECGNLRRVTQVGPTHYELILSPDINQKKEHFQWFYFEVSNIVNNINYTFEIINCLKSTSMYSKGMQPVMYSVRDALAGRGGWVRAGDSICYYRNLYTPNEKEEEESKSRKRGFYSIRFNITFHNNGDICYFAYHFPYTFSYLKTTISRCLSLIPSNLYYSYDALGESLGGNPLHLLTVTSQGSLEQITKKNIVFLSSRVHPGESNSSWMMHGILESLLTSVDPRIEELRSRFVLKIVPILNPDGVINGSHRCSLSGVDLNRVWDKPSRMLHPEIYHSKAIIQYMCDILKRPPFVFVDLHGHSRKANVFMFGNNPEESWRDEDKTMHHDYEFMTLPEVMEQRSPAFSFNLCQFGITKGKESSARVTVWRQFGVNKAYTMESTYSGFETGAYKGFQIGTKDLKEIGRELLFGILDLWKLSHQSRKQIKVATRRKASKEATNCKN
ncbi:hypothetical protein RB195_007084 [Necator americanus]|uniref:Peptidase M14 domain-containing protein n=1 Tax=Necator americanus TaxID=51031 RepID=A0ABR1BVJ4_NECAM